MKYTRFRALTRQIRGEAPGPEGSILKLSGSELGVRIADAAGELLGMHALVNEGSELVPDAPRWFNRLVAARQYTISAGTSEIQRNILGERVLGPPERLVRRVRRCPTDWSRRDVLTTLSLTAAAGHPRRLSAVGVRPEREVVGRHGGA